MQTPSQNLKYLAICTLLFVAVGQYSCKKFVQIDPPTTLIAGSTVYSNNSSAAAVITGLYSDMIAHTSLTSGNNSIGFLMGLAADELKNYNKVTVSQIQFYENALTSFTNGYSNYYFWSELYNKIYVTNAVLTGLQNSTAVTDSIKRQLTGEAEFMRAFFHFYATNLYGDVPLVTTTNYLINNSIPRTSQAQVYEQIISDLKDAESKLGTGFVDANDNFTTERTRPNQGAASALLARVYLYSKKWDSAEAEATKVINNSSLYSLDSLSSVFLANSTEAIWQLAPNDPGFNTWDAYYYVLHGVPGNIALSTYLINAFETGDARLTNWVGTYTKGSTHYYYPNKYKVWQRNLPVTEYTMVLRLSEQYLVRAEAEANLGDSTDAIKDLNMIRTRAWLPAYAPSVNGSLLSAILHERQVELFTEWGHRWFDLSRTSNLNALLGAPGNICSAKNGSWNPDWALLPIALQELQINPNLHQNPGY